MRVGDFIETRELETWGKKIRVVDNRTHNEVGKWYENKIINSKVKSFKVTKKYLFIFV